MMSTVAVQTVRRRAAGSPPGPNEMEKLCAAVRKRAHRLLLTRRSENGSRSEDWLPTAAPSLIDNLALNYIRMQARAWTARPDSSSN